MCRRGLQKTWEGFRKLGRDSENLGGWIMDDERKLLYIYLFNLKPLLDLVRISVS